MMSRSIKLVVSISGGEVVGISADGDADVIIADYDLVGGSDAGYTKEPDGKEKLLSLWEIRGRGLGKLDTWFEAEEAAHGQEFYES